MQGLRETGVERPQLEIRLEDVEFEQGLERTDFGAVGFSVLERTVANNHAAIQQELKRQVTRFERFTGHVIAFAGYNPSQYWVNRKSKRLKSHANSLERNAAELQKEAEEYLRAHSVARRQYNQAREEGIRTNTYCAKVEVRIRELEAQETASYSDELQTKIEEGRQSASIVNLEHSRRAAGRLAFFKGKMRMLERRGEQLVKTCLTLINNYAILEEQRALHGFLPYTPQLPQTVNRLQQAAEHLEHLNEGRTLARQMDEQDAIINVLNDGSSPTDLTGNPEF